VSNNFHFLDDMLKIGFSILKQKFMALTGKTVERRAVDHVLANATANDPDSVRCASHMVRTYSDRY